MRKFRQFEGFCVNLLGFEIISPDNCGWITIDEDGTVSWWWDKPEIVESEESDGSHSGFWAPTEEDTYALHLGTVEGLEEGEWRKGYLNLYRDY